MEVIWYKGPDCTEKRAKSTRTCIAACGKHCGFTRRRALLFNMTTSLVGRPRSFLLIMVTRGCKNAFAKGPQIGVGQRCYDDDDNGSSSGLWSILSRYVGDALGQPDVSCVACGPRRRRSRTPLAQRNC